ncbi:MAG: hypothetical protein A2X87_00670 [Deltaproteobacteria bacterium GWC2_42_51]|nr:MAG: hypothetical protein A2X87_00670 [Deltaproteobacteria bacterium GWC2_42_51]OGP43410.1 MAG: hypothetical protein A2090_04095 [Deltaproteobacteria bacterium GWD2_42_10]OGP46149.1 MAG: hypothetical protein A2022_01125 [Deltaproteobacteria bacterium GWF2_42_12]OGQ35372.1 MAG: hypothetical protein A3H47_07875 [Deltaproteobacteria bacterium RIFCSPLOWO2_02_FULL_42_39]OGQ66565.1 MAG: hypothetical protein A3F88_05405 [Deltaproteobacteria bacterium RIFCSPLOWO2_12_FULL_42_16]OGQ76836.1 MAG: hypot
MFYIILTYLLSPLIYALIYFRRVNIRRILVIQTAKIGDIISSTHIFREIKKGLGDVHLSVMVSPVSREVLEYNPYINELISLNRDSYKGLSGKINLAVMLYKGKYDAVISLNPSLPFLLSAFWGLVSRRIFIMPDPRLKPAGTSFVGITYKMASRFCTYLERHIRGRLVAETNLKMLEAIGIKSNNLSKEVYKSPIADVKVKNLLSGRDGNLIGIAVSSGNKMKELGAEKIVALAEKLITEFNAHVVLIGSSSDSETAGKIITMATQKEKIIDSVGCFRLSELPALLEKLSLFIGVDTGVTYIADALGVPLIDIAGPSDMEDQRPTGKNSYILQKKELGCVPCSHAFDAPYECRYGHRECITRISVKEVFGLASQIMVKV